MPKKFKRTFKKRAQPFYRRTFRKKSNIAKVRPDTLYAADKYMCKLKYYDQRNARSNATFPYMGWRLQSSIYDPEPSFGPGSIGGYNELAAIYYNWKVMGMSYRWDVANAESFPVTIAAAFTVDDPGNNSSSQLAELPYSKTCILGPTTGKSHCSLKGYISAKKIIGDTWVTNGASYVGGVSSDPTTKWYVCFSAQAGSPNTFTTGKGLLSNLVITYYVEFFNRKSLTA